MTADAIGRRALCRGLVSRAARAVAEGPGETLASLGEDAATDAEPKRPETAPVPGFFDSFEQCHTLIAEMRPFLADAIRDLGIDPRGKSDVELAREIMAHQGATPAPAPESDPSDARQTLTDRTPTSAPESADPLSGKV
jgi:hypothetical protein